MNVSLSATYADPEGAAGSQPGLVVTGEQQTTEVLRAAAIRPPRQPDQAGDVRIDHPREGGTEIKDGGPGDTSGPQGTPDGTIGFEYEFVSRDDKDYRFIVTGVVKQEVVPGKKRSSRLPI